MSCIYKSDGVKCFGAVRIICAIMPVVLFTSGCIDGRIAEMQKQIDALNDQVKLQKAALVTATNRPDELIKMCYAHREALQAVKEMIVDAEQRLRELDGKFPRGGVDPNAVFALGIYGGSGGRIDKLEDRVRKVEKSLSNLEFDIDYGR